MAKMWPKFEENCLWYVGDGASVDTCDDHWIAQDIKIVELGIQILVQLHAAKVIDLVKENGEWDWDFLDHRLPEDILYRIASMLPYSADAGPNGIAGIGKDCKKFFVSTMYIMLDDEDTSMEDDVWTDIWRPYSNKRM